MALARRVSRCRRQAKKQGKSGDLSAAAKGKYEQLVGAKEQQVLQLQEELKAVKTRLKAVEGGGGRRPQQARKGVPAVRALSDVSVPSAAVVRDVLNVLSAHVWLQPRPRAPKPRGGGSEVDALMAAMQGPAPNF